MKKPITHRIPLILASTSEGRQAQLRKAGLTFTCQSPKVDEDTLKAEIAHLPVDEQALRLGRFKGQAVSEDNPESLVISGDQICVQGDEILHKPLTNERVAQQLMHMSGKTHQLYTSGCVFKAGHVVWEGVAVTSLHMRELSQQEVDRYTLYEDARFCCTAYKIEGLGLHFVERIDGDGQSIMGLPLLGLLNALHAHNFIRIG